MGLALAAVRSIDQLGSETIRLVVSQLVGWLVGELVNWLVG